MIDNCYIDQVSTAARFGVSVTKGGYSGLLGYPSLVEPESTDWPEADGIEVDLSAPRLQPKEITISFLAATHEQATDFIAYLGTPGYRTLHIPALKRSWQVRLWSQPANKLFATATSFSLKFREDMPVRPHPIALPEPGEGLPNCAYELDGVPLSRYNLVVEAARDELLKAPTAKQNLNRKVRTQDGCIYDAGQLVFASKEVVFKCLLKAVSMETFWASYDALLAALIQPGERQLFAQFTGQEYPCYYKKASGFRVISLRGPVVMEFSLTLVFTVFRVDETDYILASEAGEWILTEDGESAIDMHHGN